MSEEKKGFWKRLVEKLDKKMEEKAKQGGCCCSSAKPEGKEQKPSCCS